MPDILLLFPMVAGTVAGGRTAQVPLPNVLSLEGDRTCYKCALFQVVADPAESGLSDASILDTQELQGGSEIYAKMELLTFLPIAPEPENVLLKLVKS